MSEKEQAAESFDPVEPYDESWPCACVKRDAKGKATHIKLNAPLVKRCRKCGCTKQIADQLRAATEEGR